MVVALAAVVDVGALRDPGLDQAQHGGLRANDRKEGGRQADEREQVFKLTPRLPGVRVRVCEREC